MRTVPEWANAWATKEWPPGTIADDSFATAAIGTLFVDAVGPGAADETRLLMKQVIDLRPVYHRREDRIRAHIILCWLALLLARITENACGQTWPGLRRELDKIHIGTFTGPVGTFRQCTELTKPQRDILKAPRLRCGDAILFLC